MGKFNFFKLNDKGSSLVTLLITIAFISLLGTILLTSSGVNYQMKQMDKESKGNFYSAEQALDDVYNGLGTTITECVADAYSRSLAKMTTGDATGGQFNSAEAAYDYFKQEFVNEILLAYGPGGGTPMDVTSTSDLVHFGNTMDSYILSPDATVVSLNGVTLAPDNSGLTIEKLVVTYSDTTRDFVSSVTTDIVIKAPTLGMFDAHDYLWDYALIGNKGVYARSVNSGTPDATSVIGNVFAGYDSADPAHLADVYGQKKVYGGLNVFECTLSLTGSNMVSAGDINLKKAKLNVTGSASTKANLWSGTIRMAADGSNGNKLDVNANVFTDNDLEVDSSNSTAVLAGNYYGYNNNSNGIDTKETVADGTGNSRDSAIIVNGRNNTLDLTGLNTLLLAGRAYLDFDNDRVQALEVVSGTAPDKEYATGEALAFKTNQLIYMVPTEFLPCPNPALVTAGMPSITTFDESEMSKDEWFGTAYLNPSTPVRQEKVKIDGTEFMYYLLNFKNDTARKDYVKFVLNSTPTGTADEQQAYELKGKLDMRAGVMLNNDLFINSHGEQCNIYSNYAVLEYQKSTGTVNTATAGSSSVVNTNAYNYGLASRYDYLCKTLDSKEDVPYTTVIPSIGSSTDLPLSKYVRTALGDGYSSLIASYANYPGNPASGANTVYRTRVAGTPYDLIIAADDDVIISGQNFTGIILAMGNVTLENCELNGMVLCNKKITLKNASIKANKELVQSIIAAETAEEIAAGTTGTAQDNRHFIYYLKSANYNNVSGETKKEIGTDYTEFIHYDNWKKGDVS